MNVLELQIDKLSRRIKRIEENPNPNKLYSIKLRYELELEQRTAQLEAWKQGKPPITWGAAAPVLLAMGFLPITYQWTADAVADQAAKYFDIARAHGLPDDACDYMLVCIAMCLAGEMPIPSFTVACNGGCDIGLIAHYTLGKWFDFPIFVLDVPPTGGERTLKYVTDQLGEMIEFAEAKVPGIKYNEEKLLEIQEIDKIGYDLYRQIYEIRKAVPCPIPGREAFRQRRMPSDFPNPRKALAWLRTYRDELFDRAAKGFANVKEEKLRVLWNVTAPVYYDIFSIMEGNGVSTPYVLTGSNLRVYGVKYGVYGDETEYGRKLSPLEEEARFIAVQSWGGLGERYVEDVLDVCKDLKCDAIVNFLQAGCVATLGVAKLVGKVAEEQGIPTLNIEGRGLDRSGFSPADFDSRLEEFIKLAIMRKGLKSG